MVSDDELRKWTICSAIPGNSASGQPVERRGARYSTEYEHINGMHVHIVQYLRSRYSTYPCRLSILKILYFVHMC